ncbi:MAG TPA: translation initiation factor IF-2 [Chthoniobacterales bacterium]
MSTRATSKSAFATKSSARPSDASKDERAPVTTPNAAPSPKPAAVAEDLISPKKKKKISPISIAPLARIVAPQQKPAPGPTPQEGQPAATEPAKPAARQPVVSLIDEKPVSKSSDSAESRPLKVGLPPISRINAPKPESPVLPPISGIPTPPVKQTEEVSTPSAATVPAADTSEKTIHIKSPIIIKELANQLGLKPFQIMKDLMDMNIFANINQTIEPDVAAGICRKHGAIFEVEKREKGGGVHKPVVEVKPPAPVEPKKADQLVARGPIITFMGHVDHGKTSLMDAIRKTRVAAGEAGGITQHIGAYRIERNGQHITFLDTPGHAAFTAMRARGANVTDIVVLVVAADDGLMPQTLEAISHAKAAKVKIIVAINKIDLPSANIDRVKGQLQEKGLTPEDWGGDVICVPVSATKGTGVDDLIQSMLLEAEMLELKANDKAPARGTVIEAQIEAGRGPVATVIVQVGTLKAGDAFICGNYSGKVKALITDTGAQIKQAGPSTPVKILGFIGLPNAGDALLVMESEKNAKALSEERLEALRKEKLATPKRATLENLFDRLADDQHKTLEIIVKCDVQGSLEAVVSSLEQINSKKIDLVILHSAVGPITESDVLLATASDAVIIGFGVKVESSAAAAARRENIQIKLYSIIYELIDQVKEAMAGLLDPELRETIVGHAEIKQVFQLTKGIVAGCLVTDGRIVRTGRARVLRKRQPIYDGGIATLRRFQDEVKEVRSGLECGIKLGDFNEYEVEDVIECYNLEKVPQKL